jgi:hypothetical protein
MASTRDCEVTDDRRATDGRPKGKFVAWWEANIRSQGEARKEVQDHGLLSVPKAEKLTGIKHQTVSKWRGCAQ